MEGRIGDISFLYSLVGDWEPDEALVESRTEYGRVGEEMGSACKLQSSW